MFSLSSHSLFSYIFPDIFPSVSKLPTKWLALKERKSPPHNSPKLQHGRRFLGEKKGTKRK